MNTNYSSHKANEDESLFYSHEPEPSAFRSEHQPPGITKDSNGTCVIEHLNVIGSDDPNLRIAPTDRVLGEGNFGVVQESSYHLAQVAVKRLKRNVSDSALDEFVHETLMNVYALELCSLTRFILSLSLFKLALVCILIIYNLFCSGIWPTTPMSPVASERVWSQANSLWSWSYKREVWKTSCLRRNFSLEGKICRRSWICSYKRARVYTIYMRNESFTEISRLATS